MRHRRIAVSAAAVLVGLALVVPARAVGPAYGPPYDSYGGTKTSCTAGATCRRTWDGTEQGRVRATLSYSRSSPITGDEYISAYGGMTRDSIPSPGTSSATVTFTWRIARAVSTASSGHGLVFTSTSVSAGVLCRPTCTTSGGFTQITAACDQQSSCRPSLPSSVTGKIISITVQVSKVPRGAFSAYTAVAAYSYSSKGCFIYLLDQCGTLDETHAGKGTSTIDAQLMSIRVAKG